MEYRYLTTSLEGFVQQLACNILPHGYWFYVRGSIPDGKRPAVCRREAPRSLRYRNLPKQRPGGSYKAWPTSTTFASVGSGLSSQHTGSTILRTGTEQHPRCQKSTCASRWLFTEREAGGFLRKSSKDESPVADGKMRARVQIARREFRDFAATFLRSPATGPLNRLRRNCFDFRMSRMHQSEGSS